MYMYMSRRREGSYGSWGLTIYIYIYMYIYVCIHVYVYIYIYVYIAHAALIQVNTSSHIRDPTKTKGLLEGLGVYKTYIYM